MYLKSEDYTNVKRYCTDKLFVNHFLFIQEFATLPSNATFKVT